MEVRIPELRVVGNHLVSHVRRGDWRAVGRIVGKAASKTLQVALLPFGLVGALALRAIRPWLLIRIGILTSERIGHLAANTELYLCERDAGINRPVGAYI